MCLIFACSESKAQLFELQQLLLDIQKLSTLKTILSDMKTGYEIVDKGYTTVRDIVQGNFNLHKLFLDGLLAVSPAVRDYKKIADIISAEATILKEYKAAYSVFAKNGHFSADELNYLQSVYSTLFNESEKKLDELVMVITANDLRMSDDERLSAIDRIYKDITGKVIFLRSFNNSTSIQALQRSRQANDINAVKGLYGLD